MIFLQNFISKGFKSFANKVDVSFDGNLTGIVGPNGSGKTNFIDGIKWVLGEQSNKELRSRAKNELVFHGSQTVPAASKATVTLKFNNKTRILKYDADEVVVTKNFDVAKNESTFYINEQLTTLTAVKALFANSGLTKDSLCIISNHSVDWFANAKPAERKEIFISAAGVKPFLQDKKEAIKNLNSTSIELDKLNNTIRYINKDADGLRKQVGEVELYNEKLDALKRIELNYYGCNLATWTQGIADMGNDLSSTNKLIEAAKAQEEITRDELDKVDAEINRYEQLESDYEHKIDDAKAKLDSLKERKVNLDAKRQAQLNSADIQTKLRLLAQMISEDTTAVNQLTHEHQKATEEYQEYKELVEKRKRAIDELNFNYQKARNLVNDLKNEIIILENTHANALASEKGVTTLLKAKNNFNGLNGLVQDYLSIPKKYETAMGLAFGKTLNHLIVDNENVASQCIEYLKNNRAGRCSFIPLNVVKPKTIDESLQYVLTQTQGYLGTASSLIKIEPRFQKVLEYLVGNVIIADEHQNAKVISQRIKNRYKVITLDGDVFNAGGTITGGYLRMNTNVLFNYQEKLDNLNAELKIAETELFEYEQNLQEQRSYLSANQNDLNSKQEVLTNFELKLSSAKKTLASNQDQYNDLTASIDQKQDLVVVEDQLSKEIVDHEARIQQYQAKLTSVKNNRFEARKQSKEFSEKINQLNKFINESLRTINDKNNNLNTYKNKYQAAMDRIVSFYKMTEENVIENFHNDLGMEETQIVLTVNRLKNELANMKNINLQAAEQLKEIEANLDEKNNQKNELLGTISSLKEIIARLQKQAVSAYTDLIDKINETLPTIFEYLFNGGWCKVSLDESNEDIFEQGINVSVNPVGQKITSLYLLSSGQKTLVALSVLFAILKASNYPLVIFDEAEAALDPNNVVKFAHLIKEYSKNTQFMVITHRDGTMQICDYLYGVTMPAPGVTDVIKLKLEEIRKIVTGD